MREALLELQLVDELTLTRAVAKEQGLPFVDLRRGSVAESVLELVPAELGRDQGLLPVLERGEEVVVAVDDPLKRILVDQLEFALGRPVRCALATPSAHAKALAAAWGSASSAEAAPAKAADAEEAPIIRLADRLFREALEARASDIHIEPGQHALRVRFRIDGVLRDIAEHPLHLAAPLISRLKVMGRMDIAERRKPQDGRLEFELDGRAVDVRVSILPSNHGETMVMRLLDRSAPKIGLTDLGLSASTRSWLRDTIARPNGIVLVTGPTGSGKTTSLYAVLSELNRPDVKILTAEDPVEYQLAGINQVQVHPRIGLSFTRILKAMLRAAPNVILVGEIRDRETAEVAIQAALTGHLVFSTLHTNDAPSAITRLTDMGVAPFLVSTAVQGIVAQRLVRRLCACAESYAPSAGELASLRLEADDGPWRRPKGCPACEGTGYRGRVGLFETLSLDSGLRELIFGGAGLAALRSQALGRGALTPLWEDGLAKIRGGDTSVAEVLRVVRPAESASRA